MSRTHCPRKKILPHGLPHNVLSKFRQFASNPVASSQSPEIVLSQRHSPLQREQPSCPPLRHMRNAVHYGVSARKVEGLSFVQTEPSPIVHIVRCYTLEWQNHGRLNAIRCYCVCSRQWQWLVRPASIFTPSEPMEPITYVKGPSSEISTGIYPLAALKNEPLMLPRLSVQFNKLNTRIPLKPVECSRALAGLGTGPAQSPVVEI